MSLSRKVIDLKEYSTIAPVTEYIERSDSEFSQDKRLEEFSLTSEDQKLAYYLKRKGILQIRELKRGIEISTSSYIGVAQFSEFNVVVMPKFLMDSKNLPRLIEYAYDLEDIIIPESEIKFLDVRNQLIEIIISSFVKKCQQLLREGLIKSYVTHEDNIPYLRGKLLLPQQFLNVAHKKMIFTCEFDELEYNNLENQIVRFCLDNCYYVTQNESLKREIRRLIHQFSGFIEKVPINLNDFNKITYTRLNQHYYKIHQLCKLIITSTGISDFYQQKIPFVNSFFVDMNLIFEAFVAKLFKQHYPLQTEAQKNKKAWITSDNASSNIRTDILVYDKEGSVKSIIDTKYKKKISEADRFQIGFYIHEYKIGEGYAILPKQYNSYGYEIQSIEQKIIIKVRYIDMDKTVNLIFSKDEESILNLKSMVHDLIPV